MSTRPEASRTGCFPGINRPSFLADMGMGFTGPAPGAETPPTGNPHFLPKAQSVIWFFMVGGTSHMESFDPRPELNKYVGKTIEERPYKKSLESPYLKKKLREPVGGR